MLATAFQCAVFSVLAVASGILAFRPGESPVPSAALHVVFLGSVFALLVVSLRAVLRFAERRFNDDSRFRRLGREHTRDDRPHDKWNE